MLLLCILSRLCLLNSIVLWLGCLLRWINFSSVFLFVLE